MAPDEDDDDDTIAGLLFFMLPSFEARVLSLRIPLEGPQFNALT